MQHAMTIFIADRKINNFMESSDLKPKGKWFCAAETITFKSKNKVSKNYFIKLIEESKTKKDFWIPAVIHESKLYHDVSVDEISDGVTSFYTSEKQ